MVDLLFFQLMYLSKFLDLGRVHADIINLDTQIRQVLIDPIQFDILCLLNQLRQCRKSPLNSLDPHIVVHLLPH